MDCKEKFGETPYLGGARDLAVWTGVGQVKIEEYDGYESVGCVSRARRPDPGGACAGHCARFAPGTKG